MTIQKLSWVPDLSKMSGPKYRAIANALAADIAAGSLKPGDRLPPQRELAWSLQVTVGTVTRAYQEAERSGLVGGEVGRGTFVRARQEQPLEQLEEIVGPRAILNVGVQPPATGGVTPIPTDWYVSPPDLRDIGPNDKGPISMQFNFPPGHVGTEDLRKSLLDLSQDPNLCNHLFYQSPVGTRSQAKAGVKWLGMRGLDSTPDNLVICSGAHNGILACLAVLCRRGGKVATEELVYPGLRAIARLIGVDLVQVTIDEEGMCPRSLREVLGRGGVDAVYTVPTLHNPTNVTQSVQRRKEIATVLEEFKVPVVEDDLFGLSPEIAPAPLTTLLPELGYCVTSLSKSLAPGLRVGFIHSPARSREQIVAGVRGSTWMAAPLMVEIASRWILDGTAERMLCERHRIDDARRGMARDVFQGLDFHMPDGALHMWLTLPDPWHASQFVEAAKEQGVILSAAHAFSIGRNRAPFAVRVCLGPPSTEERLMEGLQILRRIIDEQDPSHDVELV